MFVAAGGISFIVLSVITWWILFRNGAEFIEDSPFFSFLTSGFWRLNAEQLRLLAIFFWLFSLLAIVARFFFK